MSKQGSENRTLHLGYPIIPPSYPRFSPSGFSGSFVFFTYHSERGTKGRQTFEEKGVGEGQNTPETENKAHREKTVHN